MPAIGFGMLWGGYTLLFWGWCKLQGYDISLTEIVVPKKWDGKWPPKLIDDSANPMGGPGHNGVAPGDHPGDMPWTYPHDGTSADDKGKGKSKGKGSGSGSGGGGVIQV
jgi:hypothetical protein